MKRSPLVYAALAVLAVLVVLLAVRKADTDSGTVEVDSTSTNITPDAHPVVLEEVEATVASTRPWGSPREACDLMAEASLPTRRYHDEYVGAAYGCNSGDKEITTGAILNNTLSYFVEGDRDRADRLKLVLEVYDPSERVAAQQVFATHAAGLFERAVGQQMPDEMIRQLANGRTGTWTEGGVRMELEREDFKEDKYMLRLHFVAE